ncbi:uncharacterized protein LOC132754399 isoform X2 [Ruditapes philippinarum]|uniref:uncharacterized protein LOC132754399 isoform X2 n=1 Tax=Ruditapes philippinarum TaxID=129788 RepID=UPI00295BCE2B|nr:uncharacterized protein LOC132754399 isoform X2 [Ruditapes philippinarum]
MIARNSGCTVSSKSLKLGSLLLFGGFIIHVVGFSIAKWASLNMSHSSTILSVQTSYHVGLWELCVCVKIILEQCACIKRDGDQAWFKAVQAMETLGLIGLAFTGIICLILVCWRQTKALKKLNIFSILCSSQQPQRNSVPAYGPYSVPPPYTPQASWGYNTTSPPPQPDGKHYKG